MFCSQVCEVPAPCDEWGDGAAPDADHCRAVDGIPRWVSARDARRRARNAANGVRAAGADNIPEYFARRPVVEERKGGALNDNDADADEGGGGVGEGDRVGFAGAALGALFPEPERPEDVAAQTENLIDHEVLTRLNPRAIVINAGRGNAVVEADLIASLNAGHLRAAVLDVFRVEPLPPDDPLWSTPGVHITSHTAGPTPDEAVAEVFERNLQRYIAGEPLTDAVRSGRGY